MSHAARRFFICAAAALISLSLCACGDPAMEQSSSTEEKSVSTTPIDTIYPEWNAGDIVIHKGKYYRALWWTQGYEPLEDVERDEWQCLGDVPIKETVYFNDVNDTAWYAEAVNTLARDGIITGSGANNNFLPSRPITRAQFAVLLCRALNIAPVDSGDNFADAGDTWYTPYLAALKQNGYAAGSTDNKFYPNRHITRQELCTLIYKAYDGFAEDPVTAFAPYSDSGDVDTWAIQSMSWCIERGIVQGSGKKLLPNATASRAEAAQSIYNLLYGTTH